MHQRGVRGTRLSRRGFLGSALLVGGSLTFGAGEAWAGPKASPTAPAPPIIGCDDWQARPPSDPIPIWDQKPVKILVHHTATDNVTDLSEAEGVRLAHAIQNFHMDTNGWPDTGQHFTITRGGTVLEGRHRSLEILRAGRQQVEGAHCTGQNIVAIGIENEGTYSTVDPPDALWASLRTMCAYICRQYGIAPTELYGHRDFKDTACPGDHLYAMLPRLRSEVADAMNAPRVGLESLPPAWPLVRPGDRGPDVAAVQTLLDVPATGRFGTATLAAVRAFQAAHHTETVNGLVGGETWPLLVAARPDAPGVLRTAGITAPPSPSTDPTTR